MLKSNGPPEPMIVQQIEEVNSIRENQEVDPVRKSLLTASILSKNAIKFQNMHTEESKSHISDRKI